MVIVMEFYVLEPEENVAVVDAGGGKKRVSIALNTQASTIALNPP